MTNHAIDEIWTQLLTEPAGSDPTERVWRLLGKTARGVRASVIPAERTLELLIEVPEDWNRKHKLPEWRGMHFEFLTMLLKPAEEKGQLVLSLRDEDQKNIFLAYCNDLVRNLEGVTESRERVARIAETITRWERFFQRCGSDGLSQEKQSGLFGELTWLETVIKAGVDPSRSVVAWKGCERNFHDFDFEGRITEVKTSMRKEPQQIIVNNERQLDDRGLTSLHLFFAALRTTDGGGQSLPDKITHIRTLLKRDPYALLRFNDALINAGYIDVHAPLYRKYFIIRDTLLFKVKDGFPRIIDPPDGIGALRYGVMISSCLPFAVDVEQYLSLLMETSE